MFQLESISLKIISHYFKLYVANVGMNTNDVFVKTWDILRVLLPLFHMIIAQKKLIPFEIHTFIPSKWYKYVKFIKMFYFLFTSFF